MSLPSITALPHKIDLQAKPWLMLGMGPSFADYQPALAEKYFICGLNHVIRKVPADILHIIDSYIVEKHAEAILAQAKTLVMPWHPHIDFTVSEKTLADLLQESPTLQKMAEQGRLFVYNAITASKRGFADHPDYPQIDVTFFGSEAALNVLALLGVREVRSLGVDGGNTHAAEMKAVAPSALRAEHCDYDLQFRGIARTLRQYPDLTFAPLGMDVPLRIFIGSENKNSLIARVLEFTIQSRVGANFIIDTVRDAAEVPVLCNSKGWALYLDESTLVMAGLRPLWQNPVNGHQSHAVRFINCAAPTSSQTQAFPMILSCADTATRPWNDLAHPHNRAWADALHDALAEKWITPALLLDAVKAGQVHPALLVRVGIMTIDQLKQAMHWQQVPNTITSAA